MSSKQLLWKNHDQALAKTKMSCSLNWNVEIVHWILVFMFQLEKGEGALVWSNFVASFTKLQSDLRTQAPGFFLKHHYQLIKIRLRKNATCITPSQSSQWGMKINLCFYLCCSAFCVAWNWEFKSDYLLQCLQNGGASTSGFFYGKYLNFWWNSLVLNAYKCKKPPSKQTQI